MLTLSTVSTGQRPIPSGLEGIYEGPGRRARRAFRLTKNLPCAGNCDETAACITEPLAVSGLFIPIRPGVHRTAGGYSRRTAMNGIIYLVGLVVVVIAVLSFFGLR
jgi:hypothetical protein